jgi:CheY-like chemotaxis protein
MPVMDGFEVMAALKQSNADAYLPVLVLTAQPNHKLRALQAGARDFISKPFDLIEVKTRIRNMLEVRLLYKKLENYNQQLEQAVLERTAELRGSEARYRSLTELASDWYWEQNEHMHFTKISGPVAEMLGIQIETNLDAGAHEDMSAPHVNLQTGWNEVERDQLRSIIGARKPFLDFILHRSDTDGSQRRFQVSGEPMFDLRCRFTGYRGIGVELTSKQDLQAIDC